MSRKAWIYIGGVLAYATALVVPAFVTASTPREQWLTCVVLTALAILAQLYKAEGPNHSAFFATNVFYFAAVILLSPQLIVPVIAVPLIIEWIKARLWDRSDHLRHWYIQPFNIAMHLIAVYAAYWTYHQLVALYSSPADTSPVFAMIIAALVYLIVSQLLLGQAFVYARNLSWRESGILTIDNLLPEFLLLCMGIAVSALWQSDPWLILPGLAPLVLMYRALLVPKLKEEAQTDGKSGLFNARHFKHLFSEELERARRFDRPLAFIMADLDLLRSINNTYGHLAGDVVIEGIGKILRNNTREYDICGRFGGEEFAIVVPESSYDQALALAERIRKAVENAIFVVPTTQTPIHATMSLGVACFPEDADNMTDLVHEADVAVYQAKFQGRNRVVAATSVPHSIKREYDATHPTPANQTEYVVAFGQGASGTPAPPSDPIAPAPASSLAALVPSSDTAVYAPPATPRGRDVRIGLFVGTVTTAGVIVAILGMTFWPPSAPLALLALVILVLAAELLQISVYEDNSMSVSIALIIAGGLLGGLPGVIVLSLSTAIADQVRRRRPAREWYKITFNWATHVLAATPIAIAPFLLGVPLSVTELPVLLGLAIGGGAVAFAIDSLLISAAISVSKNASLLETWHTQFRWLASHYIVLAVVGLFLALAYNAFGVLGILVFALPAFMLRYSQQQYVARTQESVRELRRMNTELTRANREIAGANQAIQEMNDELLEMMARVLDARDPFTGGHAAKVAYYASAIAQELHLPDERIKLVRQAALLHDIGKIAISDRVLHKPTRLTSEEYEYVKQHANIGANLLEQSRGLRHLAAFVRYHHERWDGKGYPQQLKGEAIPLEARILGICDAVEAMISDRPYRQAMPLDAVINEVRRCAGTQFDPTLATLFIQIAEREREALLVNSAQTISFRCDEPRTKVEAAVA
ncbi:MAG: diguanylate cyclase [Chloroflexi bacterium]|nr:diguanylate cyclase [Chloroflexota bacterium]